MSNQIARDTWTDLEIRIFQKQEDSYPVEVTLAGQQEYPRGYLSASIIPWSASGDLAADGQKLFEALFQDIKLSNAWAMARTLAPKRRVRFRIDPTAPELHLLPWELLQEDRAMLSAQADTPFSRYLPIALPWSGQVTERPISVLVAISDPDDLEAKHGLPQADVTLERQALEEAFGGVHDIRVDWLDGAVTLERLEDALRKGYHILHLLGHGAFSARRRQAALYLQDAQGHTLRVLDDEFVNMLARQGIQPRLVFLAACQSAARSSADAFLGLSPKLVSVGVPAVVAMQDFVSAETARKFSSAFYRRLLEHGQVDLAVNEARSHLLTAGRPDAAVPALFMRLRSGQLWGAEADARSKFLGVASPDTIWADLIKTIKSGKCTPIIGPHAHGGWLPTPEEVARRWAVHYNYPFANQEKSMARVAQYMSTTLKEYVPHRTWLETLQAEFTRRLPDSLKPAQEYDTLTDLIRNVGWADTVAGDLNEPHRVLASLNLPLYMTTNCDSFMVEALVARGKKASTREVCRWNPSLDGLASHFDGSSAYRPTCEAPMVYHLFGSDEAGSSSLVLTEDNYLDFLGKMAERGRIPDYLRGRLSSTSLLFVGYSLYDWEFRVLMRGLVATLGRRLEFQDIAVQLEDVGEEKAADAQEFLRKYFERANINVVWGSTAQFIAELRERWEAAGR